MPSRFNDEPGAERKVLPQYDDPIADEVKPIFKKFKITFLCENAVLF